MQGTTLPLSGQKESAESKESFVGANVSTVDQLVNIFNVRCRKCALITSIISPSLLLA